MLLKASLQTFSATQNLWRRVQYRSGAPEVSLVTTRTVVLCMPRRPFYWHINKHGVHTFDNKQLGLKERDESTNYPAFMHLWATHLPSGTRASPTQWRCPSKTSSEGSWEKRAQTPKAFVSGC